MWRLALCCHHGSMLTSWTNGFMRHLLLVNRSLVNRLTTLLSLTQQNVLPLRQNALPLKSHQPTTIPQWTANPLKSKRFDWIAVSLFALLPFTSFSETLTIPVGQQGLSDVASSSRRTLPQHGERAADVQDRLGKPIRQRSVGIPVISAWEYPNFWVYFEEGIVLRSVLKHTPQAKKSPSTPSPVS